MFTIQNKRMTTHTFTYCLTQARSQNTTIYQICLDSSEEECIQRIIFHNLIFQVFHNSLVKNTFKYRSNKETLLFVGKQCNILFSFQAPIHWKPTQDQPSGVKSGVDLVLAENVLQFRNIPAHPSETFKAQRCYYLNTCQPLLVYVMTLQQMQVSDDTRIFMVLKYVIPFLN